MNTPYMTVRETAEYFQLSIRTIQKMVQKRVIPHFKIGKNIRIKKEDIESFEKKNHVRAKRREPF